MQAECWGQLLKLRDGRWGPGWVLDRWCWIGEFQGLWILWVGRKSTKLEHLCLFSPCFQVFVFGFWMFLVLKHSSQVLGQFWSEHVRTEDVPIHIVRLHSTVIPYIPTFFFPQQYPMFNFVMNIALSYRIQLLITLMTSYYTTANISRLKPSIVFH